MNRNSFFLDINDGLKLRSLWTYAAFYEVKNRYQGSFLGPFWISVATLSMVLGMGFLYSALMKQPTHEYIPYLSISLTLWSFIVSFVSDSTKIFIDNASKLKGIRLPFSYYIFKHIMVNLIVFLHNLVVIALVYLYYSWPLALDALYFFPLMLVWIISGFFTAIPIAVISTRFRDLSPIIGSFMQLAFFVTPIIWTVNSSQLGADLNSFNPFFHFIELLREPLFGRAPPLVSLLFCLSYCFSAMIISFFVIRNYKNRIVFWV